MNKNIKKKILNFIFPKFKNGAYEGHPPSQWITFLPFISQKILLNIKDVEFDFRMGCILVNK